MKKLCFPPYAVATCKAIAAFSVLFAYVSVRGNYRTDLVVIQSLFNDTLPYRSLKNTNLDQMFPLIPRDGDIVAFDGKDSVRFKRREVDDILRAKQGPDKYEKTFTKLEVEAEYPGGPQAWNQYVENKMKYPEEAKLNGVEGVVIIQFIVDLQGKVRDVKAVSGPTTGGLRDEAIRLVRNSGYWHPGLQNGRLVVSYKKQLIKFTKK